jgi:uncharacterized membrane protein YqgA involved in biofilm formation
VLLLGTWINAGAILLGGLWGLLGRGLAPRTQVAIKGLLGVLVVFTGLGVSWSGLATGGVGRFAKHLLIAVVAMMLGHLTGRLLRLQDGLNRLGAHAGRAVAGTEGGGRPPWSEGFLACTILYCLPPLAVLGSVLDGVNGHWQTLALKGVMDGLATMAFVTTFGWSAMAAVVPVMALQGSLTMGVRLLAPQILSPAMTDCLLATTGLLVFCVALLILEIRKVELANYLPSLLWAPALAWAWS